MRTIQWSLAWALTAVLATAQAQDDPNPDSQPRQRRGPEFRQQMIEEFDADGDGQLSEEERQTARQTMRERRRSQDGQARPRGAQGRGGPGAMRDPNALFDQYDADGDGKLSREEFLELSNALRGRGGPPESRPRDGRGPRRGPPPAAGAPDRPGPPPEARDFGRRPPSQNQAAGPPGPPEDRGFGRGPGRGRGLGPGPQGPPGPAAQVRPPRPFADPNRLFDRFDENGDDFLSREEFLKLTETMRERRQQYMGQFRGGRDRPRRGPGAESRPARPQRPESAAEPDTGDPPPEQSAGESSV